MSFTMYMGMIVGMLAGVLSVVIALLIAKRKGVAPLVEEDERTELVKVRAGNLTFWAVGVFSFVGWVTDNIARHGRDLPVAFFSPWSIIFFAMIVIYIFACMYESWKVSDNDAAPDDKEMKVINGALGAVALSLVLFSGASLAAGDQMDRSVRLFLIGLELFLVIVVGAMLVLMRQRRKRAEG